MAKMPTLLEMLQSGMHFGHQQNRWHPKMEPYIFAVRSGVHVINLEKTQRLLAEAAEFVKGVAAKGGTVLFLGTKRQAQAPIKEAAQKCSMPYITERWLGGFITNFEEIKKLLKRFREMKASREAGELEKYTKKERVMFDKEIAKLESYLEGVEQMDKMPDAVFIMDIRHEKTAREEAKVKGVPIVAVCDTNVNPKVVDYVIPANDDAVRSIAMVSNVLADAINEGRELAKKAAPATVVPAKGMAAPKKSAPIKISNPV